MALGAAGFVAITISFLLVATLVTRTLETGWPARIDDRVVVEVADARTPTATELSVVASGLAETIPVIAAITVLCAALLAARRPFMALLIGIGFALEPSIYAVVTYLVPRRRPPVAWLEPDLPPDASFPSGHVAAAVVLYGAVALIAASLVRRRSLANAIVILAGTAVVAVAGSRIYRGEHHPTDVLGGATMGFACLATAVLAVRTGVARRQIRHVDALRAPPPTNARESDGIRSAHSASRTRHAPGDPRSQ